MILEKMVENFDFEKQRWFLGWYYIFAALMVMRCFCSKVFCCFIFPKLKVGWAFHVEIVRYSGLLSYFDVLCFGILSFFCSACLVFALEVYSMYWLFMLAELCCRRPRWVKTFSWTCLRWWRFRKFICFKELVPESYFLCPVMDFAAKFCTDCSLLLSFCLHPPQMMSA